MSDKPDENDQKKETKRKRFGKFLILDHLVDGGMAKIYRGRYLGEQADKLVAIKMIKSQFSKDQNFQQMFIDEIKVTFGFIHPNIIQTYDYGMESGQLYVTMEYCDGRNLKDYVDKLKKHNCRTPIDITIGIITQVCQALHYAHTYTDKLSGKDNNVIHRDISPHNIMMTYDGVVKVIDFGIAKADTNSDATQAGTLKGKLGYLAPEYLEGASLDHRYDQFAVGITMWEMLCNRKLFTAANELAILKKIQECKIPKPSSINPKVHPELDALVMKALSRDRDQRFKDMNEMNKALIKFLYSKYTDFSSSNLSAFAGKIFKKEIQEEQQKFFEYGQIDIKPYIEDWKNEQKKQKTSTNLKERQTIATANKITKFDFDKTINEDSVKLTIDNRESALSKRAFSSSAHKIPSPLARKAATPRSTNKPTHRHNKTQPKVKKQAPSPKELVEQTHRKRPKTFYAAIGILMISGFFITKHIIPKLAPLKGTPDQRNPASVETPATTAPSTKQFGTLVLNNFDKFKQKVFVNSIHKEPDSIYSSIKVKSEKNLFIRIESKGKRPFVTKANLKGNTTETILVPEQRNESFVNLHAVDRKCPRGFLRFKLYGEPRIINVPSSNGLVQLPLTGDSESNISKNGAVTYTVFFQPLKRNIQKKILIKIDHTQNSINLCEMLQKYK